MAYRQYMLMLHAIKVEFYNKTHEVRFVAGFPHGTLRGAIWNTERPLTDYGVLRDELQDWISENCVGAMHYTDTSVWFSNRDDAMMTYLRFK